MFILKTTQIEDAVQAIKQYPLVSVEWRTDGSACLLVKYAHNQYYERVLSRDEMSTPVAHIAGAIVRQVEAYFTGWAVRKGLRTI